MKDKIQKIIKDLESKNQLNQLHRVVKGSTELSNFYENFSYPYYITSISEKTYHILNNPQKSEYFCEKKNKTKRFKGLKYGYAYCGRPDKCECNFEYFSPLSSNFNKEAYKREGEEIIQKRRNTMDERYGEWFTNQEKREETCLKIYGETSHMQTAEYKEMFSIKSSENYSERAEKSKQTSLKNYGV